MKTALLKQFVRKPRTTGALFPSSSFLARKITSDIDLHKAKSVVELGPGTGAFTGHILSGIQPNTNFFAVELNPDILKVFEKRFPDVKVYNKCATKLDSMLLDERQEGADIIVSGLPWASFPDSLQEDILSSIVASLSPGGSFVTFAYLQGLLLPAGQKFKKRLSKHFSNVEKSSIEWRNLPPAFIYRCRK